MYTVSGPAAQPLISLPPFWSNASPTTITSPASAPPIPIISLYVFHVQLPPADSGLCTRPWRWCLSLQPAQSRPSMYSACRRWGCLLVGAWCTSGLNACCMLLQLHVMQYDFNNPLQYCDSDLCAYSMLWATSDLSLI